jgi:hypothetical protein
VAASFIKTYTITATALSGGQMTWATDITSVPAGSTRTFTIKPNSGYSIVTPVGGNCGGTLNGNTYTTKAITANCTVVASFAKLQPNYTVTASTSGTGGTMTPTGSFSVLTGQYQTFSVTLSSGYASKYDATNTTCPFYTANSNKWTFGPITQNCKVAMIFYHT